MNKTKKGLNRSVSRTVLLLSGMSLGLMQNVAQAAPDMSGKQLYQQECSSCHIAYPTNMLPKESWKNILSHLDEHYGDNADLPKDELDKISAWVEKHSGSAGILGGLFGGGAKASDRITTSAKFLDIHDEINLKAAVKNPKIKSLSRCEACHTTAKRGDFDEDNVRMPAGLGEDD